MEREELSSQSYAGNAHVQVGAPFLPGDRFARYEVRLLVVGHVGLEVGQRAILLSRPRILVLLFGLLGFSGVLYNLRDAKIDNRCLRNPLVEFQVVADEDVGALQVAVEDPASM